MHRTADRVDITERREKAPQKHISLSLSFAPIGRLSYFHRFVRLTRFHSHLVSFSRSFHRTSSKLFPIRVSVNVFHHFQRRCVSSVSKAFVCVFSVVASTCTRFTSKKEKKNRSEKKLRQNVFWFVQNSVVGGVGRIDGRKKKRRRRHRRCIHSLVYYVHEAAEFQRETSDMKNKERRKRKEHIFIHYSIFSLFSHSFAVSSNQTATDSTLFQLPFSVAHAKADFQFFFSRFIRIEVVAELVLIPFVISHFQRKKCYYWHADVFYFIFCSLWMGFLFAIKTNERK